MSGVNENPGCAFHIRWNELEEGDDAPDQVRGRSGANPTIF